MLLALKIKGYTLAQEARINRKYRAKKINFARMSSKAKGELGDKAMREFFSLEHHDKVKLRAAARVTHIAYTFLRTVERPIGPVSFKAIEAKSWTPTPWAAVESEVNKFAEGDKRIVMQRFAEWRSEAGIWEQPPRKHGRNPRPVGENDHNEPREYVG